MPASRRSRASHPRQLWEEREQLGLGVPGQPREGNRCITTQRQKMGAFYTVPTVLHLHNIREEMTSL